MGESGDEDAPVDTGGAASLDSAWPGPDDFEDFQGGGNPESFADFGTANLAVPPPPPGFAAPLTNEEVEIIKKTMQKLTPTPPPWAQRVPDRELERMFKEAARSELR